MKHRYRPILFLACLGLMLFAMIYADMADDSGYTPAPILDDNAQYHDTANTYKRLWSDYASHTYNLEYAITRYDDYSSGQLKDKLAISYNTSLGYAANWGNLYSAILESERSCIEAISDTLMIIQRKKQLTRFEFADVIVSFIQDIPYSYVYETQSCVNADSPCITGERFGLMTPTEFLYTLSGDCDTRSLLLYGVLRRFGYDTRIAVSESYAHALILVDLYASGDYLKHQGKKYFFWETTAEGWRRGILPPDCSDINKWHIAL